MSDIFAPMNQDTTTPKVPSNFLYVLIGLTAILAVVAIALSLTAIFMIGTVNTMYSNITAASQNYSGGQLPSGFADDSLASPTLPAPKDATAEENMANRGLDDRIDWVDIITDLPPAINAGQTLYKYLSYGFSQPMTIVFEVADGELPSNLTLDGKNGIISGVPDTPGSYTFSIRAYCPDNDVADTREYTIMVIG